MTYQDHRVCSDRAKCQPQATQCQSLSPSQQQLPQKLVHDGAESTPLSA